MFSIYHMSEYWYCPRACLYYVLREDYHAHENKDYIRGIIEHDKINVRGDRYKFGVHQIKQFEIYSDHLNLAGKLDILEIKNGECYPVELKKGSQRKAPQIIIQIKLQIMVLEDFLNIPVNKGYASFSAPHERLLITLDEDEKRELRQKLIRIQINLEQNDRFMLFPRVNDHRCDKCSFHKNCYY